MSLQDYEDWPPRNSRTSSIQRSKLGGPEEGLRPPRTAPARSGGNSHLVAAHLSPATTAEYFTINDDEEMLAAGGVKDSVALARLSPRAPLLPPWPFSVSVERCGA